MLTKVKYGRVGESRKFSFSDKLYEIKEILEQPKVKLTLDASFGICPHCKKEIKRAVEYTLIRIEILIEQGKEIGEISTQDAILIGDSDNGRKLQIPKDYYNRIFKKSHLFKCKE